MTLKEKVRLGAIAGLVLLLLLFILFNTNSVPVNIIVGRVSMPAGFLVILSALAGAAATWLWMVLRSRKPKEGEPKA